MFSAQSVDLIDRFMARNREAAVSEGEPVGAFADIIALVLEISGKFLPLLSMCKQQPPPTPPIPASLAAVGVTQETWHMASVAKYAAMQSVQGDGFSKAALRRATAEIRKAKNIKKKAAVPLALAALQTGRDESAEEIAIAAQNSKDNAARYGA